MKYSFVLILTHIKHSTKSFVFIYDCKSESRRGRFIYNRSKRPGRSFPAQKNQFQPDFKQLFKISSFVKEKEDA